MSILKTRQKLVDIARQLFAKKGIEGTTMNDIAVASEAKGVVRSTHTSRARRMYIMQ